MKKINLIALCIMLVACISSKNTFASNNGSGQNPPPPPSIVVDPLTSSYQFDTLNMPPLNGSAAAYYSYLWWMGDNGFCFTSSPEYAFRPASLNTNVTVSLIATGNYSTGGPPPLHLPMTPKKITSQVSTLFTGNENLFVQNYRNAVMEDTMYVIVTYRVPVNDPNFPLGGSYAGTIKVEMPSHGTIINNFIGGASFTPNGEVASGGNSWLFNNLSSDEERSILIPVMVHPTEEEQLNIDVSLTFDNYSTEETIEGVNFFPLETTIAESHDPNQMIVHSDASNNCDYGGESIVYTVQFQNEGDKETDYVMVECYLDEKLDLSDISNISNIIVPEVYQGNYQIKTSNGTTAGFVCEYEVDETNHKLIFEFHGLALLSPTDPNCTSLDLTKEQVTFSIKLKPNYKFGPAVISHAEITFDDNPVIITNETEVSCDDPLPIGGFYGTEESGSKSKLWILIALILILGGAIYKYKNQIKEKVREITDKRKEN